MLRLVARYLIRDALLFVVLNFAFLPLALLLVERAEVFFKLLIVLFDGL